MSSNINTALSLIGRGLSYSRSLIHPVVSTNIEATPSTIPAKVFQDLGQTFNRRTTSSFQIGENKDFIVTELFDSRDGSELGQYSGFHGTTALRLGSQIAQGVFENRKLPIYYADFYTALNYAQRANGWIPSDLGRLTLPPDNASFPVIVRVVSEQNPERNDLVKNQGLHDHFYFPAEPNQKVRIVQAWAFNPVHHPDKLEKEMGNHHSVIGINKARAVGCFALRRIGLIKY